MLCKKVIMQNCGRGIVLTKEQLAKSHHSAHTARGDVGLVAEGLSWSQLPLLVASHSKSTSRRFLKIWPYHVWSRSRIKKTGGSKKIRRYKKIEAVQKKGQAAGFLSVCGITQDFASNFASVFFSGQGTFCEL